MGTQIWYKIFGFQNEGYRERDNIQKGGKRKGKGRVKKRGKNYKWSKQIKNKKGGGNWSKRCVKYGEKGEEKGNGMK